MKSKVKVVRKVSMESLMAEATNGAVASAFFAIHAAVTERSPHQFGVLVNSLSPGAGVTDLQDDGAIIGTHSKYAAALDKPKKRDPHYREHKSYAGERTANWFDKGVDSADLGESESIMAEVVVSGWKTRSD